MIMKNKKIFTEVLITAALLLSSSFPVSASDTAGVKTAAAQTASVSEFKDAVINIAQIKFPLTSINGKVKMLSGATGLEKVTFKLLDSIFEADGTVARDSGEHNFRVASSSVKFADIQKLIPSLAAFDIKSDFKLDCEVKGPQASPVLNARLESAGGDFSFPKLAGELKGVNISAIKLNVTYAAGKYDIQSLSFKALDGSVNLRGIYDPDKTSETALEFQADNIDAAKLASYFEKYAGKITGSLRTKFSVKNFMNEDDMSAAGNINFQNGVLKDFDFLKKLGEKLKSPVEKIDYDFIGGDFDLAKGKKLDFKDFRVDSKILKLKTSGAIGADKKVAAKLFAQAGGALLGNKIKNKKLASIFKKAVSEVKLNFIVGGTVDDPKIELDMGQR